MKTQPVKPSQLNLTLNMSRMLRSLAKQLLLLLILVTPTSLAQNYFGVGVAGAYLGSIVPAVTVQVGAELSPGFELRSSLDTLLLINDLAVDVLYTQTQDDFRYYVGGGANLLVAVAPGVGTLVDPGLHLSAGLESRQQELAFFGEAQAGLFTGFFTTIVPVFKVRAGVNIYY